MKPTAERPDRRRPRTVGERGEDAAAAYLERLGWRIAQRNVRTPFGEIDLLAEDGETLVVVEVKTRTSGAFGAPEEAVTETKRRRLCRSAAHYLHTCGQTERSVRFDVIALEARGSAARVRHHRNAFSCEGVEPP